MAMRTKPFRIFETDTNAISQLAAIRSCSGAELVHDALQEYLVNHRVQFEVAFMATQEALAAGDLGRLGEIAARAREAQVDAIMADLPT
ncbi:MAG: hypothetical protein NVSMB52_21090 [Chloroflexota bacterium]